MHYAHTETHSLKNRFVNFRTEMCCSQSLTVNGIMCEKSFDQSEAANGFSRHCEHSFLAVVLCLLKVTVVFCSDIIEIKVDQ